MAGTTLTILVFYLATYVKHRFAVPIGWDAPGYAWRTNLADAFGLGNLPGQVPNPGPANPGRPAFPVIASILGSLLGTGPLRIAMILPGVMAAATGLAAGVAVRAVLGRPRWQMLVVAGAVGTSASLVHAINVEGYQDNMIAIAVLSVAVTAVLLAVQHRRAVLPAVVLVGACGIAHWNVFGVVAATLALTALFLLPWSLGTGRPWRRVLIDSPAGRVAQIAAGGAALAVAWIAGLLTAPLPRPRLDEAQFVFKAHRDLPSYHLELALPAAAGGALSLAAAPDPDPEAISLRARAFLALMLAWCQVTLLFFVWGWVFGKPVPTHRVLAMCLAIPMLAVVGLIWVAERAWWRWRPLAVAIVLGGLALSASASQASWLGYRPVMRASVLSEAATAARYLRIAQVATERPVVFVIDDHSTFAWSNAWLFAHTIRAALPPDRIAQTFFYVGQPEDYLDRRPTSLVSAGGISPSRYGALSGSYFGAMASTYRRDPVALILRSANPNYDRWAAGHPQRVVAPGVAVVRGEVPGAPVPPAAPPSAPAALTLAGLGLGGLALLSLLGAGWTRFLLGEWLDPVEVAALSPAVGAGMGVLGGVALAAARIPLRGVGAILIAGLIAVAGWGAELARRRKLPRARAKA